MRAFLSLCFAAATLAQTPAVTNGRLETRALSGDLGSQMKSTTPTWFGYTIQTPRRSDQWCDGHQANPVRLEGSDVSAVLFRVENNQVEKVKLYSLECELDAGGLPLIWFTGVSAQASLAYLQTLPNDRAIFVISQHAGNEAVDILIDKAKNSPSTKAREQAVFWLSQRAGAKSAAAIVDAIINDPDTAVKKKAVFALSQLPHEEGVPKLIEVARSQRNPEVRKQAFFWLGQTHDPRALAYIEEVLTK